MASADSEAQMPLIDEDSVDDEDVVSNQTLRAGTANVAAPRPTLHLSSDTLQQVESHVVSVT